MEGGSYNVNVLPHPSQPLRRPHPPLLLRRCHHIVDFSSREAVVAMAMHVDSHTMRAYSHGHRYSKQSHVRTSYRDHAVMVTIVISVMNK